MSERITEILKKSEELSISMEVPPEEERFGYSQADYLAALDCAPNFIAVSWGLADRDWQNTWNLNIAPIRLSKQVKEAGKNVLLHLSYDLLSIPYLERVLKYLQENGICNLFIVGAGHVKSPFQSARDLIKFIREFSGDYFCIGVPGLIYSDHNGLVKLKEIIDVGADFIITEAIFDAQRFIGFKRNCSDLAIDVPIIAGVQLIETKKTFRSLKAKMPVHLYKKDPPDSYYGEMLSQIIQDVMPSAYEGKKTSLHFYMTYTNVPKEVDMFILDIKNKWLSK